MKLSWFKLFAIVIFLTVLVPCSGPVIEARSYNWNSQNKATIQINALGRMVSEKEAVLRAGNKASPSYIPPPRQFFEDKTKKAAVINVTYNGFSSEAQTAFQYAVDIWETLIDSPITIEVVANWTKLEPGDLASAYSERILEHFPNAPRSNTLYTSAVANRLAGYDLIPNVHDITGNFNSVRNDWYFGTDGKTPSQRYDFVSVVLHELGHGLGFTGGIWVDNSLGRWDEPNAFDRFVVNGYDQNLLNTTLFPQNSSALTAQLTSNNIYFSGINAIAANNGTRPKLYVPPNWSRGSSLYHLDESFYPAGSANALMTPILDPEEAVHNPGPITSGVLDDVGWGDFPGCSSYSYEGIVLFDLPNCGEIKLQFSETTELVNLSTYAWNDKTSSIHIASGWSVRAYQDDNGKGDTRCVTWSLWELSRDTYENSTRIMDEDISSIKVFHNNNCTESPLNPPPIITPIPNDTTSPTVGNYTTSTSGGTANLTVSNVNDASGIREVRFSAKFNNRWVGIGNDTSAPYALAWDMCAWGVPDGDVELGMEAWDNAGNVYIWSQHYPNPHITKSHNCAPPQQSDGVYLYPNDGLDPSRGGECRVTQDAPSITNYCGNGWNDDVESVRTVGPYRAVLFKDDLYSGGEPLYIDFTAALPDAWRNQASSIRVRRTDNPAFTLYSLGDYNGESWPSDRTIFDMGHWRWNDKAQSIRVHAGYSVIVCSDADFKSACGRATGPNQWSDINALAQGLRDGASSIRVCPGSCPDAGPNPTFYYPTSNQTVDGTQPLSLRWGGDLNQFFVELWGGALDGKRQYGWTNDVAWNIGTLPISANPYYWRVKGWRGYGETGWAEGSFYIAMPDKTQPTGKMTAPNRFGYRNDATITLRTDAADSDSGVAQVEFFIWLSDKWEFLGTDTTPPYEYIWNTSSVREGGLWVSANIVDKAGNSSGLIWEPDWVFFTLDHTPPSSAVLPLPETVTTEQFTVRWNGVDNYTPNDLIFYDIQYQLDCIGDWLDWFVMGNIGGASFNGQMGHSYCFRSRAYDLPGNAEAWSDQPDVRTQIISSGPAPTFTPTPTATSDTSQPVTPTPTATATKGNQPAATRALYLPNIHRDSKSGSTIGVTVTPSPVTAQPAAVLLSNALVETCKWAIQMGLTGFTPNSPITVASAYSEVTCPQGQQNTASWSQVYPTTTDSQGALVVAYLHQGTGSYTYTFTDPTGKSATLSFNTKTADVTGTPVPTPLPSATPTFTPSPTPTYSQLLAYAVNQNENVDIYQMRSDGSAPKNLTNHPAFEWGPSWSPDGEQIAFVSNRDGNFEIYVMNADGSAQRRLTQNTLYDIGPVWSLDGQWIAYKSFENGDYRIYLLKADGSAQQLLTTGANSDWRMSWSPDGTRLAFSSFRNGNGEIYLINADGTGSTRITNEPTEDNDAAWSPDGGKLAFVSRRDGNQEIYVVNLDGSNPVRLTNNPAADSIPIWSPDGSKLAFTSNRDGFDAVYLMNADGSAQTRITNGPHGSNFAVWRPR